MLNTVLNYDYALFLQINGRWTHLWFDYFFIWITDLNKTIYFKFIIVPLVAFLFIKNFKREGVSLFLVLILALAVGDFVGGKIKKIALRDRPFNNSQLQVIQKSEAGNYSFYSNHASNMFTFATYTANFIPVLKIPLFTVAAAVAYSRVYNGVHYPSDILFGSTMGIIWGLLFSLLAKKLLLHLKNRKIN